MKNRERVIYLFTLVISLILLINAWAEPPQGWWHILLDIAFPIALALGAVWGLWSIRKR